MNWFLDPPPGKPRCQCEHNIPVNRAPIAMYKPEERKAMTHAPGKCPGDYLLKQYIRKGKTVWLCSCCFLSSDEEVPT